MNTTAPDRLETGDDEGPFEPSTRSRAAKKPAQHRMINGRASENNEVPATRTLGWIEMTRKNFAKSEEIFTNFLKLQPGSGQVSYWLATSMLQQKIKEKQIPAIYHLARAAHYTGPDALPDAAKKQLQAFLEKTYINFHGSKEGLDGLVATALKDPFPTTEFKIKSAAQILQEEEEEMRQKDPQKYLWIGLKKGLTDPAAGADYWANTLKGSALPKLKGTVISTNPPARPKEVVLGILTKDTPEIKLRLDPAHGGKIEPGTEIEFEGGVAAEFGNDPFLLTLDQEKEKVTGLPAAPAVPRTGPKAGGAVKKAVGKKK
ncbi:MAG: hypothetical protein U0Q16_11955 [Bryobacteraceae bacterium]